MKKIIICLLLSIALSNCEISVNKAKAQYAVSNISCSGSHCVEYEKVTIDSMELGVFQKDHYSGGMFIINLTKEKLEIELLKKQLNDQRETNRKK